MQKAETYRKHALQCRKLALANTDQAAREKLLEMAKTWESLAVDREMNVARQERIAALDKITGIDKKSSADGEYRCAYLISVVIAETSIGRTLATTFPFRVRLGSLADILRARRDVR